MKLKSNMPESRQSFKTFYGKIIKTNEAFSEFSKIKKASEINDVLDNIVVKFILSIDDDINEREEKSVTLAIIKDSLDKNFGSDFLEEAFEFGDQCVTSFQEFKKKPKEKTDDGKIIKTSSSQVTGLIFPISRIRKIFRDSCTKQRINVDVPIFLTAVIETYIIEVLHRALENCSKENRKTLRGEDIKKTIKEDDKLNSLSSFLK